MSITTAELKSHLEQYLEMAEATPVIVEKSGHIKSVLISYELYEKLIVLMEDAYWLERAKQAESEGYLGQEASKAILNKLQAD